MTDYSGQPTWNPGLSRLFESMRAERTKVHPFDWGKVTVVHYDPDFDEFASMRKAAWRRALGGNGGFQRWLSGSWATGKEPGRIG